MPSSRLISAAALATTASLLLASLHDAQATSALFSPSPLHTQRRHRSASRVVTPSFIVSPIAFHRHRQAQRQHANENVASSNPNPSRRERRQFQSLLARSNNNNNDSNDNDDILTATIPTNNNVIQRLELDEQFSRWKFLQQLLEGEITRLSDVEEVMLLVLNGYLNHGPTTLSSTKENNGGIASPLVNDEMKSLMEGLMHDLTELSVDEENLKNGRILHMLIEPPVDYESEIIDNEEPICNSLENGNNENDEEGIVTIHPKALSLLQAIEKLLPDPVEDEENHKGAWDLVMDLNGRESVRIREEKLYRIGNGGLRANGTASDGGVEVVCRESLQWRTVSAVTRVLIYYDFLTKGVLEMGAFE